MTSRPLFRFSTLLLLNVVCLCVLGFYRTGTAAPQSNRQPFANSVSQRQQIIDQLKELNRQLKQQNTLLQSGQLKVIVAKDKAK